MIINILARNCFKDMRSGFVIDFAQPHLIVHIILNNYDEPQNVFSFCRIKRRSVKKYIKSSTLLLLK